MEVPVNYLAVLLAGLSNMVVGYLWYGPLFGKTWMKLSGVKMEGGKGSPAMGYIVTFITALLAAFILSHFIYLIARDFEIPVIITSGMTTAFWAWLGLIVPATISTVLWEGKPWALWFLNIAYWLVSLFAMAAILAGMGM